MDPNANLREMREKVITINTSTKGGQIVEAAAELAELVEAMDEWLTKGGFAPIEWTKTTPEHWQEVLSNTNARAAEEERERIVAAIREHYKVAPKAAEPILKAIGVTT